MLLEAIFGAATGIIGNVIGGIFKYKTAKLENEKERINNRHEVNMVRAETQAMIMESKANIAIAKNKIEGEIDISDANIALASQKEGNKSFFDNKWVDKLFSVTGKWRFLTFPAGVFAATAFGFIDFLRGIIRPTLTTYLVGLTTYITLIAWEIVEKSNGAVGISPADALDLLTNVTNIVVYLTVSCVTWWFGDRRMSKTIMSIQKKPEKDENVSI